MKITPMKPNIPEYNLRKEFITGVSNMHSILSNLNLKLATVIFSPRERTLAKPSGSVSAGYGVFVQIGVTVQLETKSGV